MTLKANANQQSNSKSFRGERHLVGRAAVPVPELRRISRHPGYLPADAILVTGGGDVNSNFEAVPNDLAGGALGVNSAVVTLWAGTAVVAEQTGLGETKFVAAIDEDEEDEDDDLDDDDLDEDDDEDFDDEDEEDYEDDDDLDEDLDDDDLDQEDDDDALEDE